MECQALDICTELTMNGHFIYDVSYLKYMQDNNKLLTQQSGGLHLLYVELVQLLHQPQLQVKQHLSGLANPLLHVHTMVLSLIQDYELECTSRTVNYHFQHHSLPITACWLNRAGVDLSSVQTAQAELDSTGKQSHTVISVHIHACTQ